MILVAHADTSEEDVIIDAMVEAGISQIMAMELYLFIPIAFCRLLLKEINFKDTYIDYYSEDNLNNKEVQG